jgi:hypothetical protein
MGRVSEYKTFIVFGLGSIAVFAGITGYTGSAGSGIACTMAMLLICAAIERASLQICASIEKSKD